MQVHFETTGCRLNQIESESAARFFSEKNFSVSMGGIAAKSPTDEETILCVVNTCAVTQKAEQKDRRIIRLLLEKCPNAVILVTGCYAQLSAEKIMAIDKRIVVLPGLFKSRIAKIATLLFEYCQLDKNVGEVSGFEAVDGVGIEGFEGDSIRKVLNKSTFFDKFIFSEMLKNEICSVSPQKKGFPENAFILNTESFLAHSRPSIKIQDGCNNSCSYCTIHIARGHSVSMKVQDIIDRVLLLEQSGMSEVVITSVNIAQYRGEYQGDYLNFAELLSLLLKKTKKINFRISSIYPEVADEFFCDVIKDRRVRPHFHISVQSGSNKILKAMARNYKAEDVVLACERLQSAKKNAFLACDIITGFPDETPSDFEQTLALCKKCNFAWIHVFPFSERPGTPACSMKNKVPQVVSGERAKILSEWARENKIAYINSCIGKEFEGVLENARNLDFHVVTENFLHCKIVCSATKEDLKPSSAVRVKIIDCLEKNASKGGELDAIAEIL